MAYGFDVDRLLVWLAPRDPDGGDPMRAGSLCKRHADAMVVPLGWTLDDRRDATPRLFRTAPRAPTRTSRRAAGGSPPPSRRRRATPDPAPQLGLDATTRRRSSRTGADGRRGDRRRRSPTTIPTPRWPSRGCRRSTTATTSTGCWPRAARCSPGRSAARTDRADAHDRRAAHPRRRPGQTCSSRSPRSTATRRGCGSSTASSELAPGRRPPGVARPAAGARRPVRPLEAAAHGAHRASSPGAMARFERIQDDDRDHAEWILTATVAPTPTAGRPSSTELTYTGVAVGVGRAAADPRRRDPARQGRPRRARQRRAHALKRPFGRRSSSRSSPNVALEAGGIEDVGDRSGRAAPARARSSMTCVDVGGMSSTWWVTTTLGGAVGIGGEVVERGDELLAPAEVEARRRLVEQDDRPGRSSACGRAARAGARPTTAMPSSRSAKPPTPIRSRHSWARVVVGGGVAVPPRLEGGVAGRAHDVERGAGSVAAGRRGRPTRSRRAGAGPGRRSARAAHRARRPCRTSGARTARRCAAATSCRCRWRRARASARPGCTWKETSSRIVVEPRRITIRSRWRVRVGADTAAQPRHEVAVDNEPTPECHGTATRGSLPAVIARSGLPLRRGGRDRRSCSPPPRPWAGAGAQSDDDAAQQAAPRDPGGPRPGQPGGGRLRPGRLRDRGPRGAGRRARGSRTLNCRLRSTRCARRSSRSPCTA